MSGKIPRRKAAPAARPQPTPAELAAEWVRVLLRSGERYAEAGPEPEKAQARDGAGAPPPRP